MKKSVCCITKNFESNVQFNKKKLQLYSNKFLTEEKFYFAENVREIVVMWSTMDETNESTVKYFLNDEQYEAKGQSHIFVDGGKAKHQQYIHKVRMRDESKSIFLIELFNINYIFMIYFCNR